jgi:glucose uptake protein
VFVPQTFVAALLLIVVSMLCWGSWPNFMKALPRWRLEYFYLDYTFGGLLMAILLAATLGSPRSVSADFLRRMGEAGTREMLWAATGGFIWNIGNILLLIAIVIAGIAVAYPVASVLAIIVGVGMGYVAQRIGNALVLVLAVVVLCVAAGANAASYRNANPTSARDVRKSLILSVVAGILIGLFAPFVGRAISGTHPLDSYILAICFLLGSLGATLLAVPILLAWPVVGEAGSLSGYFAGKPSWHLLGLVAGAIWCIGTVAYFASAGIVGVAVGWGIGSGAPMVGALWGIFLWKEFAQADGRARRLMSTSMMLYIIGVITVAVAYQLR